MNAEQFFKIARRIKWHVKDGAVRAMHVMGNSVKMCPLAYVTSRVLGDAKWHAYESFQLPTVVFQNKIVEAADYGRGRKWLLRGLGLVK